LSLNEKTLSLSNIISFISTTDGSPWGGSEELWSRTAVDLVVQGFGVSASVLEWSPPHKRVLDLGRCGVEIWSRPAQYPLWKKARQAFLAPRKSSTALEIERFVTKRPPRLVVFSDGGTFSPVDLLELCIARKLPFVTIGQANSEGGWPNDNLADRYRSALAAALRCYFVSKANRRLAEKQIGCELSNAEVVWNPFNVGYHASLSWPDLGLDGELRLACVARLHPPSKGQDILFEVLAGSSWTTRPWRLFLYGEGPMRNSLEHLAYSLGLSERVVFAGHVSVEEIWATNHALVMPSRYEGLPLAMVEAMLCARPVVATDVAGHAEIVEDGVTGFLADAPTVVAVAAALERFWRRRDEAEEIGKAGARRIRKLVPPDPTRVFSDKLKRLVGSTRAIGLPV